MTDGEKMPTIYAEELMANAYTCQSVRIWETILCLISLE